MENKANCQNRILKRLGFGYKHAQVYKHLINTRFTIIPVSNWQHTKQFTQNYKKEKTIPARSKKWNTWSAGKKNPEEGELLPKSGYRFGDEA